MEDRVANGQSWIDCSIWNDRHHGRAGTVIGSWPWPVPWPDDRDRNRHRGWHHPRSMTGHRYRDRDRDRHRGRHHPRPMTGHWNRHRHRNRNRRWNHPRPQTWSWGGYRNRWPGRAMRLVSWRSVRRPGVRRPGEGKDLCRCCKSYTNDAEHGAVHCFFESSFHRQNLLFFIFLRILAFF